MNPESIWGMIQKTASVNVSLRQVLAIKSDDAEGGSVGRNASRWELLLQGMYKQRLDLVWPSTNHLCLTADASTHSYQDAELAIGYSWELGQACYPLLQFVVPGKNVYDEEDLLTPVIGRMAAENRLTRVAAYRQLQATSHMTEQLHGRSLDEYDIEHANLEPAAEGEVRVVVSSPAGNVAYLVNRAEGTQRRVLPEGLVDIPLLVLLLDQGSIGSAGSGFTDHLQKLILMKWEKIHRLIRDIKLPFLKSCKGAPLKAQVYSSYLWNISSKPFGSGFFGTVMQRALNVFPLNNTIRSARFQKYLHRLSIAWNMPQTTDREQQDIFDRVCDLRSIRNRLEQSKLGRWFSWNASCEAYLLDFWAHKMIVEDYLDGPGARLVDPDDSPIEFADLASVAKAKTPQAQITKLREQGGLAARTIVWIHFISKKISRRTIEQL